MGEVNVDLQSERDRCTFKVRELTTLIDGGTEKTYQRKQRERIMLSCKEVFEGTPEEYLSHKERYEDAIKKAVKLFTAVRRMQDEDDTGITNYRDLVGGLLGSASTRDGSPLGLHYIMFMPAILNQATEEQQQTWLSRAWNCSIIGSYAQTELGHGTFVRGLETTATYHPETREFELHSPTLTAYKWWPGGLGHTANYCIVVAQLHTKGECHGIHSFIVQVRDEESHTPLPGITVGDIGAKLGLNAVNNGFLGFDHVRIPRDHMLMKHAQVLEDGTYVKSKHSKLNYGAMVFVRVVIVFDMVNYLTKAVTIATRYSAVRRQSHIVIDKDAENQILDYATQQHKILEGIAACHALRISASRLWDTFNEVMEQLTEGNLARLTELHALACCLKALSTTDTGACVERCRLACGAHGYLTSSNLPLTYGLVTAACTYEGDNTVLLLQTARFLIKVWHQSDGEALTPTVDYLKSARAPDYLSAWTDSVECIIKGFRMVASRKVEAVAEDIRRRTAAGVSPEDAWNAASVRLVAAAEAHCRTFIISTFYDDILKSTTDASPELKLVLNQLVELYATYWSLQRLNDLLRYTPMRERDVAGLQHWYEEVLNKIRPNAVGLVDAFDISDDILQSSLGAYDGRVYERLMAEALRSPLNEEPVNRSFHQYLKPFMQGKL